MGTTQRYLMFFSYIGSAFRGSQFQTFNGSVQYETVQYVIEEGLKNVFKIDSKRPFYIHLASRTDTGVHALRAAMSVDLPKYDNNFLHPEGLKRLMNSYLKGFRDIRILEAYAVPDTFKFREFCVDKTYLYRIGVLKREFYKKKQNQIPIVELGRTELIQKPQVFDLKKVQEAAHLFEGVKDFGAVLGKPSQNTRPTICNIKSYTVERAQPFLPLDPISQKYDYYHFMCTGDRFLYHMVRRMVGISLGVGFNTVTLDEIKKLFVEPVPSSWPRLLCFVPSGCGLYLVNVNIDLQELNQKHNLLEKTVEETDTVKTSKVPIVN